MGNAPSQPPVSDAVASSLSPRAQQRLSQAPYANFFEAAAVTTHPVPVRRRKRPTATNSEASSTRSSVKSGSSGSVTTRTVSEKRPSRATTVRALSSDSSTLISDATSLPPPKLDYTVLKGRRYPQYPDARFFLPCDDDESDRIVILHFLLKYAFNGNFLAPVDEILRDTKTRPQVLDVGCGAGTWVLEMASDFPNADFHGIDIVPLFPTSIKPSNARFTHHDIFSGLPFADNTFDFVHVRLVTLNLTQQQVNRLLAEIARVLKPLGFIEYMDVEYRIQRPGPICQAVLNEKLTENMRRHDIDLQLCYQLPTFLMTGGFVDVYQDRITIPLGWGGQLGQIHAQIIESFYRSLHPDVLQATSDEIHQAIEECEKYQSHLNWYSCYAQKPSSVVPPLPSLDHPPTPSSANFTEAAGSASSPLEWDSINDFVDGYID